MNMILNKTLQNRLTPLVQTSALIGKDPMLIQGSGGNTSQKIDGVLWVKASGHMLMNAEKNWMFVPVDLKGVRDAIDSGHGDDLATHVVEATHLRPSIETTLHALLPHPVVLHAHAVHTIAWAVQVSGKEKMAPLLEGLRWAWIPYCRPGLPLTEAVCKAMSEKPDILVLQNHGLVVGGASINEAMNRLEEIDKRFFMKPRSLPKVDSTKLKPFLEAGFRLPKHTIIHGLATDPACLAAAQQGVPYPDHVVFLPPEPLIAHSYEKYTQVCDAFQKRFDKAAPAVLIPGVGVVVRDTITFGAEEMLRAQAEIFLRVPVEAEVNYLSNTDVAALLNWDAEKFRQNLSK